MPTGTPRMLKVAVLSALIAGCHCFTANGGTASLGLCMPNQKMWKAGTAGYLQMMPPCKTQSKAACASGRMHLSTGLKICMWDPTQGGSAGPSSPPSTPAAASSAGAAAGCGNTAVRNEEQIAEMVQGMQQGFMSDDKVKALNVSLHSSVLGLSGAAVVKILDGLTFTDSKLQAMQLMNPYIADLTCAEVVPMLERITMSDDKLTVLRGIADQGLLLNVSVANCMGAIKASPFSSYQKEAEGIILGAKKRSCIYGTVTAKQVVFVVDTSGSMGGTFKLDSQTYTRLSYVSSQLSEVVREGLDSSQQFNVLRFSSDVAAWRPGLVSVNADNVQLAAKYINGWRASGGTGTYAALAKAYAQKGVRAIYLLSDGMPNGNTDQIIRAAKIWSKNGTIPVYTAVFVAGGGESTTTKLSAASFMKNLAQTTGGVYKSFGVPSVGSIH